MKRILTIGSVLSLMATGAAMAADSEWSISGSSTDPKQNIGTAVPGGVIQTYLWLVCADPFDGVAAMECNMQSTFANPVGTFIALGGALATGAPDLLLAVPCAHGLTLCGSQAYFDDGSGGTVCLVPSLANGKFVTVDCWSLGAREYPTGVTGYSSVAGTAPCSGDLCITVSVEPQSWGTVKGLYR